MSTAIKVENLSKAYQLGEIGTGTISRDLERWWAKARGKEDPFLRIGETNDKSIKGSSDIVWSLKDINFDVQQGDAVGIIGRNGAGKSTLLKILSRVTSPTTGSIKIKGRVASLLEVGTGFHPELSGRENIFLNGAILGMRKAEIRKHFDAIVDFSGVERYIDTPVKRYSSGMYVRLAFAVAAYLESEILIVDEVLAVGDAEFQKKCLGKMGDISKGEGRTVLFVSHNMGAIKTLCEKGIVLANGCLTALGPIDDVLRSYHRSLNNSINISTVFNGNLTHKLVFDKILLNDSGNERSILIVDKPIKISVFGDALIDLNKVVFIVSLFSNGVRLFTLRESSNGRGLLQGQFEATFHIKPGALRPGAYSIGLGAWGNNEDEWIWGTEIYSFSISSVWTDSMRKSDEGIFNSEFLRLHEKLS